MRRIIYKTIPIFLVLGFCLGCGTLRRMTADGGSEFVVRMETDQPNKEAVYERAVARMRNLSDALGASAEIEKVPNSDNEYVVKIYKKEDPEQLKRLLFADFQLEFRKVSATPAPAQYTTYPTEDAARQTLQENQEALPFAKGKPGFIVVEKTNVITGDEIRDAEAVPSTFKGEYSVQISLTPTGAAQLADWSEKNLKNYLAVIINKQVVSVAAVMSKMSDTGQITGKYSKAEAENIALSLKSGQAAVKYQVLSEKTF